MKKKINKSKNNDLNQVDLIAIDKTLVLYDCTRMLMYLDRKLPSGIERVDISYLEGVLQEKDYNVVGVVEWQSDGRSILIMLSNTIVREIYEHLNAKWIKESVSDNNFDANYKAILSRINAEIKKKSRIFSDIDARIIDVLTRHLKSIYINSTFINIPDGDEHYKLMAAIGVKTIHVIHDLIPIEFPEYTFNDQNQRHLGRLIAVNNLGGVIVAISDHVKSKIESALDGIKNEKLKIVVNRNGVNEKFISAKANSNNQRKNQFVYVSTIEPRKNHALLLNLWRRMADEYESHESLPKLLIIGRRGWGSQNIFDTLDKNMGVKINIVEKNNASDQEIIKDILESKAMLFPSFDEGWGLPIVESLALGTPVICSDIPVHRECSQGVGVFIDNLNGLEWLRTIKNVASDSLQIPVEGYVPITWKTAQENLQRVIKECI
jgi:glycosyltransferase involved in cell wall biosynthesis